MSYRITMAGLRFFARHGVLPEERRRGQAFYVDLALDCAGPLPAGDRLEDTVDYAAVYQVVRQVVTGGPHQLLETVVHRMARQVLDQFPQVAAVTVTLRKPQAPLPGPFQDVAVSARLVRGPDGETWQAPGEEMP
ncbi:MAG TPA: dihydroneopterin aldolase [Sphingobacteriaceae bacterium]|nr:dihydroneopterin aldolase [Sphingobacteriaceae bacterium]